MFAVEAFVAYLGTVMSADDVVGSFACVAALDTFPCVAL